MFGCQYNIEQDGEIIGKANPISYRFVLTHNLEHFYDFLLLKDENFRCNKFVFGSQHT